MAIANNWTARLTSLGVGKMFEVSRKSTVITLRWPVVIVVAYMLLISDGELVEPSLYHLAILFYFLTNAVLYRFDESRFDSPYFYVPIVVFDTVVLTLSLIISGRAGTDFYLTYFLIIILCAIWQDLRWSIAVAILVSMIYGYILFLTTETYNASLYIRFPFLFVSSLFYGYFAQVVRREKVLKEQAETERWKAVANLAAGVAHEVKNPLAILLQGVGFLSTKAQTGDEDTSMVLQDMKEAVQRADSVVRGLLDFSSMSEVTINPENLNQIIETCLLLMKNPLDRQHILVTRKLNGQLPQVRVDRRRIEQVFINLFLNAIEAMPGGGRLTVKSYATDLQNGKGLVVADIENEGAKIPEDVMNRLFEPFFTTKRNMGGTGLGLSIVKNIMDTHNGSVKISNQEDGGVRVSLLFPV